MPDGFWFVSFVVVGLVAASEWARRIAIRCMRSPPSAAATPLHGRRRSGPSRARDSDRPRGARVVVLRPRLPTNEPVAIPQWQKDP